MQRKIFLNKSSQSGSSRSPYVKPMLWAAVGLLLLVVVAPLLTSKQTTERDGQKRAGTEKGGMVVKEIPRSPDTSSESASRSQAGQVAGGTGSEFSMPSELNSSTSTVPADRGAVDSVQKPVESAAQVASGGAQSPTVIEQPEDESSFQPMPSSPGRQGVSQPQPASPVVPTKEKQPVAEKKAPAPLPQNESKDKIASVPVPAVPPKVAAKPSSPSPGLSAPAAVDKQKRSAGGPVMFSVQVGSFKDRQNAEEMQQNLQKRGYQTVIKNTNHPTLGPLFVVQLNPVKDEGRASTLVEQIKHEEKVKPIILKVPQGQE